MALAIKTLITLSFLTLGFLGLIRARRIRDQQIRWWKSERGVRTMFLMGCLLIAMTILYAVLVYEFVVAWVAADAAHPVSTFSVLVRVCALGGVAYITQLYVRHPERMRDLQVYELEQTRAIWGIRIMGGLLMLIGAIIGIDIAWSLT